MGFGRASRVAGAPASLTQGPDRQAGSELEEQRALGPRAGRVAETRAPGAGAGDKGWPYLREGRG